ncbi:multidrug ABC transporter permease [soil metagenome]|jgi:fluoroquinolone transport system permease protein
MSRFVSAVRLSLLLQLRYGFLYAAAFVGVLYVALLLPLPDSILELAGPLVVFAELAVVGYYFIAGMVLFEKSERTLYALVSTPLRFSEYLGSRLATLTLLALALSLVAVIVVYGFSFNAAFLLAGVALVSIISLLAGFISVLPFDSITRYLIPSQIPMFVMALPLVPFLGIWQSPVFYLLPTHGALILLGAAFGEATPLWQLLYAVLYGMLWIWFLYLAARLLFYRYVVRGR